MELPNKYLLVYSKFKLLFFRIFWICFSKVFSWWLVKSGNVELVDTDVIICMLVCIQCVKR